MLVRFGHAYAHPGLLAAIPARHLAEIRALGPAEQRAEIDKWYRWWVDSGLYLEPGQGQLFGERGTLPPWARNPPERIRVLEAAWRGSQSPEDAEAYVAAARRAGERPAPLAGCQANRLCAKDLEAIRTQSLDLSVSTARLRRVVNALLSREDQVRLLGLRTRGIPRDEARYFLQDLAAYLQEPPFRPLDLPEFKIGDTVYSWEHWGPESGWKKGQISAVSDQTADVWFDALSDPAEEAQEAPYPRNLWNLSPEKPGPGVREEQFHHPVAVRRLRGQPDAEGAARHLDRTRVGTPLYGGLAYFWNYEYRHYLRDLPDVVRKAVHDTWLKHGLPLDGASSRHFVLMERVIDPGPGWFWDGGTILRRDEAPDYVSRGRWRRPRTLPNPRRRR